MSKKKPKRRNHVALDANLRKGGPHDTSRTRGEAEREALEDQLLGCSTCPHAQWKFNGGKGATLCDLLDREIVAYGHKLPVIPPEKCPL